MTNKQLDEWLKTREKFKELAGDKGLDIDSILIKLHRYETTLHRIAEAQCSVEMSEKEEKRIEEKERRTEAKVEAIASQLGFKVRFNGDPRGGSIRFILPDGSSNGWDRETWGIYW